MTDKQWEDLNRTVKGEKLSPLPVGFIIDSPWLPNWFGISILDYFSNDQLWLGANLHAIETFPQAMFLPGFWSEYGMCSEPSAFGARSSFPENEFPHTFPNIGSVDRIGDIKVPDPLKDGLGPLLLNLLKINWPQIEKAGHKIRFSVSRGPLNIASYLMGTTEFLHNDANCMESVKYLPEMGVNLFNMGFDTDLNLLKELTDNRVTMLGNIPPRDVLAAGSIEDVRKSTLELLGGLKDHTRVILSCGGGMPPGVPTENISAFIQTVQSYNH